MAAIAFSTPHLTVLVLTALTIIVLCIAGRLANPPATKLRTAELFLAGIMCITFPIEVWYKINAGYATWQNCLPLHLCDIASYIGAYALITRRPLASELIYFWGLAGTLQALITPASLAYPYPEFPFFIYFVHHSSIVITAFYVTIGRKDFPRPFAVIRVWLWAQVYLVVASLVNFLLDTNYAFLCAKPSASGSLMDFLGPWPWYVLALEFVALISFTILYIPFAPLNRKKTED